MKQAPALSRLARVLSSADRALLRLGMLYCLMLASQARAGDSVAQKLAFFESKVRPVLVENCYVCHSAEAKAKGKLKGGLYVDTRAGLLSGGDTGPAIITG